MYEHIYLGLEMPLDIEYSISPMPSTYRMLVLWCMIHSIDLILFFKHLEILLPFGRPWIHERWIRCFWSDLFLFDEFPSNISIFSILLHFTRIFLWIHNPTMDENQATKIAQLMFIRLAHHQKTKGNIRRDTWQRMKKRATRDIQCNTHSITKWKG